MTSISRLLIFALGIGSVCTTGCGGHLRVTAVPLVPPELPPPVPVLRPLTAVCRCVGEMLRAYTVRDEHDVIVEVDLVANDSGIIKELPIDASPYVLRVVDEIGKPLAAFRSLPAGMLLPGNAVLLEAADRPKPPAPMFRIVGTIDRVTERADTADSVTAAVLAGDNHTATDVQLRREHRNTVTVLTLSFHLETPSGIMVHGTTASYRIPVERTERTDSKTGYVGGSGAGRDGRITLTQETGDALYDATAVSVIQMVGRAMLVPYTRCSSVFPADPDLERHLREALQRLSRAQLQENAKRYLHLAGFSMDLSQPALTVGDAAVLATEMQHRGFDAQSPSALVDFTVGLWATLDFTAAAGRVDSLLIANAHYEQERKQEEMRQAQQREAEKQRQAQQRKAPKRSPIRRRTQPPKPPCSPATAPAPRCPAP